MSAPPATMTTIAYKDGVLAADSRASLGNMTLPERAVKVRKLKDGRLFGWAGPMGVGEAVFRALNDKTARPANTEGTAVVVDAKGRIFTIEPGSGGHLVPVNGKYTARGSGAEYALVAMRCGKSAAEAVKIAGEFDHATDRRVQTVKLRG